MLTIKVVSPDSANYCSHLRQDLHDDPSEVMLCLGCPFVRTPLPQPIDQPNSASCFLFDAHIRPFRCTGWIRKWDERPPLPIVHGFPSSPSPKSIATTSTAQAPHARQTSIAAISSPLRGLPNSTGTAALVCGDHFLGRQLAIEAAHACMRPTTLTGAADARRSAGPWMFLLFFRRML
jgi:hypothetical protein